MANNKKRKHGTNQNPACGKKHNIDHDAQADSCMNFESIPDKQRDVKIIPPDMPPYEEMLDDYFNHAMSFFDEWHISNVISDCSLWDMVPSLIAQILAKILCAMGWTADNICAMPYERWKTIINRARLCQIDYEEIPSFNETVDAYIQESPADTLPCKSCYICPSKCKIRYSCEDLITDMYYKVHVQKSPEEGKKTEDK